MTGDRRRVLEVLTRALEVPAARRAQALDELCAGDDVLRRGVETLLALEDEAEPFLATPAVPRNLEAGFRIGPYRVTALLGRGGMGAVYRAVREDDFEKEVAIKLIRHDLAGAETVRRFHAERQILARLEHPSIARLLDGGTAEDGSPYLVMELVDGTPIDRYCADHAFSTARRLELFRQVAEAVAYAHQNLVVHRDLKPGNVLVTAEGVPKLLDFGIAKLLADDADAPTLSGGAMTLRYASPEQVLGEPITAASDVYSLGVLLYELLTGRLPSGLDDCDYQEVPRRILERDPQRPSTAAGRAVRGDVDAIVLKALRKEPRHRYASVEQLADDLRRHLDGRPVAARQGTWVYRAGKLARRHRLGVAAALLVVSLGVTSTVQWRQAEKERAVADQQRAEAVRERIRAETISTFMQDLFTSANPDAARGGELTVREIVERGRARLAAGLAGEPELKATLTGTLGDVYRNLGLYREALELLEEAARLRRQAHPGGHPDLAVALNDLASAYYYLGDWREAERRFRETLEMRRRLGQEPETVARALSNLASSLKQQGKYAAAGELYREALAIREAVHPAGDPAVAASLYSLGALHYEQGDLARAGPPLRRALAIRRRALGERHTRVATVLNTLGRVRLAAGDLDEAEALQRRALAVWRELLGDGHAHVALARKDLAEVLLARGETAAAGELLAGGLDLLAGSDAPRWAIADAEGVYGAYLAALGRYGEAEPYLLTSLETLRQARGEGSIRTRQAGERLAAFYQARGDPP